MSDLLIKKANQLRDSGKTEEAIKILTPLLKSKNYQIAVNAYSALGICYSNENEYRKAIDMYEKALSLCEKNNWPERLSGIARDLAIVYKNAKKFKESEECMKKSIALIESYSKKGKEKDASLGITYSKLGLLYTDMKKYDKAKKAFENSKKYLKKGGHDYWNLIGMIDKCNFLVASKKYQEAKKISKVAITESIKQEKEYKLVEALILAGDTKKGLSDKDGAKMFYAIAKLTLNKIFDDKKVKEKFGKEINKRLG